MNSNDRYNGLFIYNIVLVLDYINVKWFEIIVVKNEDSGYSAVMKYIVIILRNQKNCSSKRSTSYQ